MHDTPIELKPLPVADDTTSLLAEAISFVKQWNFIANHPEVPVTPRQIEELKNDRERWLEKADRWAKNKPSTPPCAQ